MYLKSKDPDLETMVRRINEREIDLQPDFQRQEVWRVPKKQKLIDTILREWAVPPIHLVSTQEVEEVLDGQQRLTAIRDFFRGKFPIASPSPENSPEHHELAGMFYKDLPANVKKKIDRYNLRVYTIYDASPQEASELFYRLNQPTALTSGEQRNALYGDRRAQMKKLVSSMTASGFNSSTIGFSNSRLAYDDVIARVLVVLHEDSLRSKITEARISDAFRLNQRFSEKTVRELDDIVRKIGAQVLNGPVKLNKASLFSYLIFFHRFTITDGAEMILIMRLVSQTENYRKKDAVHAMYAEIFKNRASSRVTDVASVVLRDFSIAKICLARDIDLQLNDHEREALEGTSKIERTTSIEQLEEEVASFVMSSHWGASL